MAWDERDRRQALRLAMFVASVVAALTVLVVVAWRWDVHACEVRADAMGADGWRHYATADGCYIKVSDDRWLPVDQVRSTDWGS